MSDFKIEDLEELTEIAKLCAQKDVQGAVAVMLNLSEFKIQNLQTWAEVVTICAEQGPEVAEQVILCRELYCQEMDEELKVAVIKSCVEQGGNVAGQVTMCIQDFKIKNLEVLKEIAKICAQQNYEGAVAVMLNLHKFKIENPQALEEVVKTCAKQSAYAAEQVTLCHELRDKAQVKWLWIDIMMDKELWGDIIKICAQQGPYGTFGVLQNIQNFNIKDQKILKEIADICVEQDAAGLVVNIQRFAIRDSQVRADIASTCAQISPQLAAVVMKHIKNFNLQGRDLEKIVRMCAQQKWAGGVAVAYHMLEVEIKDSRTRADILKMCVRSGAIPGVLNYLKYCGFKEELLQKEVIVMCVHHAQNLVEIDSIRDQLQHLGLANNVLTEVERMCVEESKKFLGTK